MDTDGVVETPFEGSAVVNCDGTDTADRRAGGAVQGRGGSKGFGKFSGARSEKHIVPKRHEIEAVWMRECYGQCTKCAVL